MKMHDVITDEEGSGYIELTRNPKSAQRKFKAHCRRGLFRPLFRDTYYGKEINSINTSNKEWLAVDSIFLFNEQPYVIKALSKTVEKDTYNVIIDLINPTTIFLLPALGYSTTFFEVSKYLINAYVYTTLEAGDVNPVIYLRYRYDEDDPEFELLEERLKEHPNYKYQLHPDDYHIIFKFSIPEEFHKDYYKILNSKYSTISNELKLLVFKFNNIKPTKTNSIYYSIFNKSEARRKAIEKRLKVHIPEDAELYQYFCTNKNTYVDKGILKRYARGLGKADTL